MASGKPTSRHAEIAGAGFAGLVTAAALAQRGWSVRVHERSEVLREFGAGIMLWDNALRVLEAVGAYAEVKDVSHAPLRYDTRMNGELVSSESFGDVRLRCPTRPDLYNALLGAAQRAGAEVVAGSEVVGADADGVLHLESGEALEADLVVGADGVTSRVRESLDFEQERTKYQDGIIRLIVPRHKDRLGGGDEWDHIIDFWNLDPRVMRVLYVPCTDEHLYLGLMAPHQDPRGSRVPLDLEWWLEIFPNLEPVITEAAQIESARYDVYETTHVRQWHRGRVAIIGDAAHAMTPSLAQGAGCAMMNGLSLAHFVSQGDRVEDALPVWESAERPLTDRVQAQSAEFTRTRTMSQGGRFDDEVLHAMRHVPTGSTN